MSTALGLLEFKTIPVGVETTDEMLKAAEVDLILAAPICPGKYISIISGEVANVTTAINRGIIVGGILLVGSHIIPNVSSYLIIDATLGVVSAVM